MAREHTKQDRDTTRGGPGNFKEDPERAAQAGQKGGQHSGSDNPGNFKNNPDRAAEAGRKGGDHSHGGRHS